MVATTIMYGRSKIRRAEGTPQQRFGALSALLALLVGILPSPLHGAPTSSPDLSPGDEVRQGDWLIANLVVLQNTTLVVDGNITIAAGGHLRLENATLVMNSTYELQYTIEVLSGGAFTAVDLDGDNTTMTDASNVTAGQRGNTDPLSQDDFFHYGFIVRDGANLTMQNSEILEIGSHGVPNEYAGLYLENDNIRIQDNRFAGNFHAIILHGNSTMTIENMVLEGNTFEGNVYALNGGARGSMITRNVFRLNNIVTLTIEDTVFAWNSFYGDGSVGGAPVRCRRNCTIEGNYWENWGIALELQDSIDVLIRNESFVNPIGSGTTSALRIDRSTNVTIEDIRTVGGQVGLQLFIAEVRVDRSSFVDAFQGFLADLRSRLTATNSSLSNPGSLDAFLSCDSHLTFINTTFDKTSTLFRNIVPCSGPVSTLTVEWFLDVRAEDTAGVPLAGVAIEVRNATAMLASGPTTSDGRFRWTVAREYVQRDLNGDEDGADPGEIVYDTPHNVTASFQGVTAYAVPEPFVNESKEVIVRFPANVEAVTITRSPEVGQILVDGTPYDVPATFSWLSGTAHTLEALAVDDYAPGSRYAFTAWSDGAAIAHSIVTPLGGGTFVASYRTQHRPTVTILGTDGHPVRFDYVANGSAANGSGAGTWYEWVDEGSAVVPAAMADGSTGVERWATQASFAGPPWTPVTAPFAATVAYIHQFQVLVTVRGLPGTSPASLAFVQFGVASSAMDNATFDVWADAATAATTQAEIAVTARERYRTVNPVAWTIDAPVNASVSYRRQFRHNVILNGTDPTHLVPLAFTLDGVAGSNDAFAVWTNWSDAITTLSVAAETTGNPTRITDDPTTWTTNAPLDVVVRYREQTSQPPPPKEANLKPAIALAFSLVIFAAALVRRRRGGGRRALLLHTPFVALEAMIGAASWAFGVLSVPPWIGPGTIVNGAILVLGLLVPAWRRIGGQPPREGTPPRSS